MSFWLNLRRDSKLLKNFLLQIYAKSVHLIKNYQGPKNKDLNIKTQKIKINPLGFESIKHYSLGFKTTVISRLRNI